MIPMFIKIRMQNEEGKRFGFWLPLFLLWPILLIPLLILLLFALIAEIFTAPRGIHPFLMLVGLGRLLAAMRGTYVDIRSTSNSKKSTVQFKIY
ncbi:MAG: hypothetical protein ACOCXC_02905 [Fibrobacterota bacterium]